MAIVAPLSEGTALMAIPYVNAPESGGTVRAYRKSSTSSKAAEP
jgi:hypothetical protein